MNLWADFDNNLQADTSGHGRIRPLTERAVLSMLRAWLLEGYVAAYCRSLGATRIFRRCCLVDALGIDAKVADLTQAPIESESSLETRKGRRKEKGQVIPPHFNLS